MDGLNFSLFDYGYLMVSLHEITDILGCKMNVIKRKISLCCTLVDFQLRKFQNLEEETFFISVSSGRFHYVSLTVVYFHLRQPKIIEIRGSFYLQLFYCMMSYLLKVQQESPAKKTRLHCDVDNNLITSTPTNTNNPRKTISRVGRRGSLNGRE